MGIKKLFVLGLVLTFLTGLTSCDLFSPKKTAKKTASQTSASAVANTAATVSPTDNSSLPANVIARVGDWTLTMDEFNQRLKLLKQALPDFNENDPQVKASVLNELIRQQLLVKDAENSDIANQKDIKDAVEDFRRTLLVQELANRITKNVAATEDEARKYYDSNKDLFVEPIKWKVREIMVADEVTAKNLLVQVLQGGDFASLAQANSKAKSASQGGALPEFTKAPFEEMQKAIALLDAGGTSSGFKGPDGYYIVRVDDKKGGNLKPFVDIKAELISGLTLRKQQNAILEYIDQLRQKTKVQVNKELLGISESK